MAEVTEILIHGRFEPPMFKSFSQQLNAIKTPGIVVLDIESEGGHVRVLEAMDKLVTAKKTEGFMFVTNVEKYAYSCGLFAFLWGDIRTASEKAEFLYHAPGVEVKDRMTFADAKELADRLEPVDKICEDILLKNSEITPESLSLIKKNTLFLSKSDMINLGLMQKEYTLT